MLSLMCVCGRVCVCVCVCVCVSVCVLYEGAQAQSRARQGEPLGRRCEQRGMLPKQPGKRAPSRAVGRALSSSIEACYKMLAPVSATNRCSHTTGPRATNTAGKARVGHSCLIVVKRLVVKTLVVCECDNLDLCPKFDTHTHTLTPPSIKKCGVVKVRVSVTITERDPPLIKALV